MSDPYLERRCNDLERRIESLERIQNAHEGSISHDRNSLSRLWSAFLELSKKAEKLPTAEKESSNDGRQQVG